MLVRYSRSGMTPASPCSISCSSRTPGTAFRSATGARAGHRYIEIVPTDTVKYELDKETGLLQVDRPQKYSNVCPSLVRLRAADLCAERVRRSARSGPAGRARRRRRSARHLRPHREGDPHGNILVPAIPIGGLRMLDGNEVDDKIVAVLAGDAVYGGLTDIAGCPRLLVDRLRHYFLTYKQAPTRARRLRDHRTSTGGRRPTR